MEESNETTPRDIAPAPLNNDIWKKDFVNKNDCFFSELYDQRTLNGQTKNSRSLIHLRKYPFFKTTNETFDSINTNAAPEGGTDSRTQAPTPKLGGQSEE